MAGIGNNFIDLPDILRETNPDGSHAKVVEMLTQMNPMLKEMYTVECNNGTSHRHTIRTGLPSVAWGKLYSGIQNGKSQRAQVDDTTGFLEGLSSIDTRVLKIAKNAAETRLSEATAFLQSMENEMQSAMFYSNDAATPEQFLGLAPRFSDTTAQNGQQIIKAGGAGSDNTSVWFITWGENTVHGLYPQGTQAGVEREDKGEQRVLDDDGNPYYVKEELFTHHMGLGVRDWRYVARIANIDVSELAAGSLDLYKFMRQAYYQHWGRRMNGMGKTVIYCNTDVMEALDGLATNAGTTDNFTRLRPMEIQGEEVMSYRGIPIREVDALLNTEELVA